MSHNVQVDHNDPYGKGVGVMAAVLAVFLSFFTICAHRSHTESIVTQNASNDQWAYYQAKRIRDYQLQVNMDLLDVIGASNPKATALISDYRIQRDKNSKNLESIRQTAEEKLHESELAQKKALLFDLAEGVLEIALVMSSLYFISRKKLFPVLGLIFAISGTIVGIIGLFA